MRRTAARHARVGRRPLIGAGLIVLGISIGMPSVGRGEPPGTPVVPRSEARSATSRGPKGPSLGWSSGFVLVLAGVGAAAWALRRGRLGAESAPGTLAVAGRVALTPRHAVHLVRVGDRYWIVGTGAGAAPTLLGEWDGSTPESISPAATKPDAGGRP